MPPTHDRKLREGCFDEELETLYRAGASTESIEDSIMRGYKRCIESLVPKHPEIAAKRRRAQAEKLLSLYRTGSSIDDINKVTPRGYEYCIENKLHENPTVEAQRRAAQEPQLLQLYRTGHSQDRINEHIPGGYQRCISDLVPKHPEVEAERHKAHDELLSGRQDACLLKLYQEGMVEMEIDAQISGGWQRCINIILPMHPEAKEERAQSHRNTLDAELYSF